MNVILEYLLGFSGLILVLCLAYFTRNWPVGDEKSDNEHC